MGKKKIAKKFASVKRIISSQDDRMYQISFYIENKTNKNCNNNSANADNFYKNRHQTKSKLKKCTFSTIIDRPK